MTMFKAAYFDSEGERKGDFALPTNLFDGVIHEGVVHSAVRVYLNNQRQGTATKRNRSRRSGGSRKPWRQKGTGRARQGTIRAPQWRGGGLAFAPQPKSWNQRLPKAIRRLARRSALNSRAEAGRIAVIRSIDIEHPKTKDLVRLIGRIGPEGKLLILTHGVRSEVYLSSRNLQNVRVFPFGSESTYDIIWSGTVLLEETALRDLGGRPDAALEVEADEDPAMAEGDADQGDADQGDADQGDADQGDADQGDADQGDADQGDADQGDADQDDADQGDADQDDADQDDADQDDADQDDADQDDADQDDADQDDADQDDADQDDADQDDADQDDADQDDADQDDADQDDADQDDADQDDAAEEEEEA